VNATFTIQPDWPVLVLEDTPERIAWFRERIPQATYVATATAAIEALNSREFRVVFLDNDLHWMHADNTIVKGTGKEVALHLKRIDFPGVIVIHSKHDEAVSVMLRYLPHAKRARFGEFEIQLENSPQG
jgi:hypothetical protein